jgi:hypothetical protein
MAFLSLTSAENFFIMFAAKDRFFTSGRQYATVRILDVVGCRNKQQESRQSLIKAAQEETWRVGNR